MPSSVRVLLIRSGGLNVVATSGPGKRKPNTNRILAHVRSGSNRSSENFAKLAEEVEAIWDDVSGRTESDIGPGNPKILQAVFIVPGITARKEELAIPQDSLCHACGAYN